MLQRNGQVLVHTHVLKNLGFPGLFRGYVRSSAGRGWIATRGLSTGQCLVRGICRTLPTRQNQAQRCDRVQEYSLPALFFPLLVGFTPIYPWAAAIVAPRPPCLPVRSSVKFANGVQTPSASPRARPRAGATRCIDSIDLNLLID